MGMLNIGACGEKTAGKDRVRLPMEGYLPFSARHKMEFPAVAAVAVAGDGLVIGFKGKTAGRGTGHHPEKNAEEGPREKHRLYLLSYSRPPLLIFFKHIGRERESQEKKGRKTFRPFFSYNFSVC